MVELADLAQLLLAYPTMVVAADHLYLDVSSEQVAAVVAELANLLLLVELVEVAVVLEAMVLLATQ
mgnify:CR=1 FL=1